MYLLQEKIEIGNDVTEILYVSISERQSKRTKEVPRFKRNSRNSKPDIKNTCNPYSNYKAALVGACLDHADRNSYQIRSNLVSNGSAGIIGRFYDRIIKEKEKERKRAAGNGIAA